MDIQGIFTATAYTALEAGRRVKLQSGTTSDPPEVTYAGAGEDAIGVTAAVAAAGDLVPVRPLNDSGIFGICCVISSSIAIGTVLYAAASGKVSDASSGSAVGVAFEAAASSGDIIQVLQWSLKSTTAATVSIADSGSLITGTTVETALAEIMTGIKTAQYTIQPSHIAKEDGTALTVFANGASGVGWTQLSSKELALRWNNNANPDDIIMQFVMPQDYDDTAPVVLHLMGAIVAAGTAEADSPTFTVEAYFGTSGAAPGADTDCGGASGEFLTAATNTWQEKTLSISASDAPAAPCVLTCVLHPTDGQLGTDDFVLLTPWLEVTRKCLTS